MPNRPKRPTHEVSPSHTVASFELQALSNSLQLHSISMQPSFAVIDKSDVRVDARVPYTKEFAEIVEASRNQERSPWRRSEHFASTADFRPFGYDVRLHCFSLKTKKPIHKLEIYDTGEKTYQEMRRLIGSVFDCNPDRLGLMRVDLCADIHGVGVGWFKRHTIVQLKQTNREFGQVYPYQTICKGRAETLYAGVKPNQIRIYNKTEERMVQWGRYARRLSKEAPDMEPTPYEVMFGHSETEIITRVERQIAARDLGRMGFSDFGSLQKAAFMSPFQKVVFYEASRSEPSLEKYGYKRWLAGMYLRQMVQEQGLAQVRGWMKEQLGRNLYREWSTMSEFLNVPDSLIGIDSSTLHKAFHSTLERQLYIR